MSRARLNTGPDSHADPAYESSLRATDSHARDLERADDRERLERALRQLPAHQRVPLVLFHFEDATYEEIARALRISLAKVKTDIHRGREALRKQLAGPAKAGHYGDEHGSR